MMPRVHTGFPCPECGADSQTISTDMPHRRHECKGPERHRFNTVQTVCEPDRRGRPRKKVVAPDPERKSNAVLVGEACGALTVLFLRLDERLKALEEKQ